MSHPPSAQLPEGKLYFKTLAWANMLSTSRGKLLLLQNRFVIRKEWRMAGVFKAEPLDEVAEDATVTVPPMRVRERFTQ